MHTKEEVEILIVAEESNTRSFQVDGISLHPEFDFFNASFNVAVLHHAEDLEGLGEGVSDLCLPEDASSTFEGQVGSVAGHALDGNGNRIPEAPIETQMSILATSCEGKLIDCLEITSHMFCAVMDGGDACLDNAGGPLTVKDGARHVLVGISSFGRDCKDPRTP
ncbi:enteropeptidase-like [Penaeus chinensis]|uniref:enteropeptidase-like n=1 Tax=Penaeus chinensis TaxID=139456 RepID=UPI001FB6B04D|nr:enteropeptidase-like [Penaeus chinensis]